MDLARVVTMKCRGQLDARLSHGCARILGTLVRPVQGRSASRVFDNGDMVFRRGTLPLLPHKEGRL